MLVRALWLRVPLAGRISLDIAMLFAMALLTSPHSIGDRETSIAFHEWLGIAIAPVIIFHLTLNWGWIVQTTRKLVGHLPQETRVNQGLDALLFVVMAVAVWSGIEVSESALPFLGFTKSTSFAWRGIHETSSNISLVLVGIHAALHWKWIVRTARRLIGMASRPVAVQNRVAVEAR